MSPKLNNLYEILNCKSTDSTEIIKKSYQLLLLQNHPDKQHQTSNLNSCNDSLLILQQIDQAWKILRDPIKRKSYDAEMQQQRFNDKLIVHEILTEQDFEYSNELDVHTHICRCGCPIIMPDECTTDNENNSNDVCDNEEIFIECDECSLVVQFIRNKID